VDYKGGELSNVYTFGVSSHHRAALSFTRGGFLRKKSASARFRNESTHHTERKQPLIMWELQRKCIFIEKKLQKDLVESEKSSTFALAFKNDAWLIRLRIRLEGWVSG
jgi:hypothetical protein